MIDLTTILQAAITLIAAVITAFVIPWIKSRTTKTQREQIEAWVEIAVAAAEQLWKGHEKAGEEKKTYVLDFLEKKGFTINTDELDAMIEAEVLRLSGEMMKGDA